MEARLNYVLLGVFLVVSLVALVGFVFWMGKYDRNLRAYNVYYLYHKELPRGIHIETPVHYLGLPVGFVESYGLNATQDKVEIIIWVKKEISLNTGTKAIVESQGLTGGNYITLIQGDGLPFSESNRILELKENWIEKVGNRAEEAFDKLNVSLDQFNQLLSQKNIDNLEDILENFKHASTQVDSVVVGMHRMIENANYLVQNIEKSRTLVDKTILRGDYNLKEILTPLVFRLEQSAMGLNRILQDTENAVNDFSKAPSGFLFGTQQQVLGPRE